MKLSLPRSKKYLALFLTGVFVGVVSLLGVQRALAASVYNIVETTATVGQSTTFEAEYTVDTAVQTWANGDVLTLQLPPSVSQLTPSFQVEYDTDTNNDGVGETALTAGPGQGQYSYAGPTLSIKWSVTQWGAPVNGASTLRIFVTATPAFAANSNFVFGGLTAAADTNPNGTDSVNIVAADAAATLTLNANQTVAVAGASQLNFYLAVRMTVNDTLVFTMPSNLSVGNVAYVSKTFTGAGNLSCSAALQVVTCTADGNVNAGTGSITLSGILSKFAASGQTVTSLAVNDVDQAGADISIDASGAVTNTLVGAMTQPTITPTPLTANQSASSTVTFTTVAAIPQGGKIVLGLPTGWVLTGADGKNATTLSGLDGVWTASVSGQNLILTQAGGSVTAAGAKSFTMVGLQAPGPGMTGTFSLTTRAPGDQDIESNLSIPGQFVAPGIDPAPEVLAVPGNIAVTDHPDGGVLITWVDPSEVSTIHILKGTDPYPVDGRPYARVAVGVQSYVDTQVSVGQTVRYILRSATDRTSSANSAEYSFVVGSTLATQTETQTSEETVEETTDAVVEESTDAVVEESTEENTVQDAADPEENVEEVTEVIEVVSEEVTATETVVFADVESHWAEEAIAAFAATGVIQGDADGNFNPDHSLNRAEAAALLYRVWFTEEPTVPTESYFEDVDPNDWFAPYVNILYEQGVLDQRLKAYQPSEFMDQEELLNLALDVAVLSGRVVDLAVLAETVCPGSVCERADLPITRAEAVDILHALFASI